jgi:tetratricopeptide (TPR) repeat protein
VLTPVGQHWNEIAERYVGDDLLAKIRMSRRKAAALSQDANLTAAAAVLKEGLALARQLGDADQEFGVASWLTLGNTDLAEMLSVANEYLGRARDSVGTLNLSRMLQFMAHVYLANGERQQAEVLVKELTDLASRSRNAVAQNQLDWITETFAMFDGNLDDLSQGMIEGAGFGYLASIAADYLGRPQPPDVRLAVGISLAAQVATARSKALKGDLAAAREDLRALVKELDVTKRELRPLMSSELLETAQLIEDDVALSHVFELCGKSLDPALILADSISPRPVFRIAGDAAQRLGYLEEARGLYEENRRLCERVGHRPELALTRAHLAELLLDHYPDERDAAIEHLDFAIAEFRDMKMQPALERALGRRGLLKA